MAKWIDYSLDERRALIAKVAQAKNIDGAAAEKDWWVTAVLYSVFHTSIADYSLFKGLCVAVHKPLTVEEAFRTDYDEMRGSFIYEEAPLSFDELLRSIASIQERFRKCKTAK